jgi:glycosyltransferase involved in cell wall biosynthesis
MERGKFGVLCQTHHKTWLKKYSGSCVIPAMEVLGQRGREMAEREFRWEQIAGRLGEFYQRVWRSDWN